MPFAFDYSDDAVLRWSHTEHGVEYERDESYRPSFYISVESTALDDIRNHLSPWPAVRATAIEKRRRGFRHEAESVLRVDVEDLQALQSVTSDVRRWGSPGEYRLYNVDFSREFRYCLETDTDPTPTGELATMELSIEPHRLANQDLGVIEVNGQEFTGTVVFNLECVRDAVTTLDPDVLIVNTTGVLSTLYEAADEYGVADFHLGRQPGFEQLAGESTYASYGRVTRYRLRIRPDQQALLSPASAGTHGSMAPYPRPRTPVSASATVGARARSRYRPC